MYPSLVTKRAPIWILSFARVGNGDLVWIRLLPRIVTHRGLTLAWDANVGAKTSPRAERDRGAFARIVEDATYFPLIIHCGTANRVGAMWTLYRAHRGIPISIAVEEGRTIGLQGDREKAVLEHLGHPTDGE